MALFNIPVIIERFYYAREQKYYVSIRPVFYENPKSVDVNLQSAKKDFIEKWQIITMDSKESVQQKMLFYPDFTVHKEKIVFEFDKIIYSLHLWIIYWEVEGAMILYTHLLDNFLYIVPPIASKNEIGGRVIDCLKKWIRTQKKIRQKEFIARKLRELGKFSNLSFTEIQVPLSEKDIPHFYSQNSDGFSVDLLYEGLENCRQTGEAIRWDADQVKQKDSLPTKLQDLTSRIYNILANPAKKSILLCGPDNSGRKHILTKVFHSLDRDFNYNESNGIYIEKPCAPEKVAWYFTPGKIISGMSIIGEWEKRVHSIFATARHFDFILYIDQIVGFLETGKHQTGELAMTDFLVSAIKNKQIRVVIKATPRQLVILREKNRSLADLLEIIPMPVLTDDECNSIYINKVQTLEEKYSCCFDLSVITQLKQLTKFYESEKSTPGAVCSWMTNLAALNKNTFNVSDCFYGTLNSDDLINEEKILAQFQKKTGLSMAFLGNKRPHSRASIVRKLTENFVGQEEAVDRMADLCLRAESLLNDTSRPIGSFLFVGPTGVGKTELARQLARYFFGNEDRLIRFDTNELTTAAAVSALLGDSYHEGSLTGMIRVQPFCVLLFDEIEKAHPSLHDLLLQVLGEARLSDGKGRLVSFSQCIIIMTSNLGAGEAGYHFGFQEKTRNLSEIYRQAAKQFFRPEFLNRIDAIIPFKSLTVKELKIIADQSIEKIRKREGFARHNTILHITDSARYWFVNQGHDTRWGARKTLRCLENHFVPPIASFLASLPETDECCLVEATVNNKKYEVKGYLLEQQKREFTICEFPLEKREKDAVFAEISQLKNRLKDWLFMLSHLYQINVFKYEISDQQQNDSYFSARNILLRLKSFIDDINPNDESDDKYHKMNTSRSKWSNNTPNIDRWDPYRLKPYMRIASNRIISDQLVEEDILKTGERLLLQNELTENEKRGAIASYEKLIPFIPLLKYREIPPCDNAIVLYSSTMASPEWKLPDNLSKSIYFYAENGDDPQSDQMENVSMDEEIPHDSSSKIKLTLFPWIRSDDPIYRELIDNEEYRESALFLYEKMMSKYMSHFEKDPLLIQAKGFYLTFSNGDTATGFILTGPNVYQRAKYFEGSSILSDPNDKEDPNDAKIYRQASCYVVLPWSDQESTNEIEKIKDAPDHSDLYNESDLSNTRNNENESLSENSGKTWHISPDVLRRGDLDPFSKSDVIDLLKQIVQWKKEEKGKWGPLIPTHPDISEEDYKEFFGENVVVKLVLF